MDQSPQTPQSPAQPKKRMRALVAITISVVAVIAISISAFVMLNHNGVQTVADESFSKVTLTARGVAPAVVTVKKGDSVTWTNQDNASHGLVLTTPNPPEQMQGFGMDEPLAKGETYSFIFEVAGRFTYQDPSNPNAVQGTVIVEDK